MDEGGHGPGSGERQGSHNRDKYPVSHAKRCITLYILPVSKHHHKKALRPCSKLTMSTIASPRPSAPSTSLNSTPETSRTSSPAPTTRRANRSALRDYYNLKPSPTNTNNGAQRHSQSPGVETETSPLDEEGFDADAYIKSVLANQSLEGVLKVEGGLINEIKGLDGERKALVYDNYSKLITATDTIRKMRANMDPLTPTTGTLGMAVGYIAETAATLASAGKSQADGQAKESDPEGLEAEKEESERKRMQRDTVSWVVTTPRRLGRLLDKGDKEEALKDWDEVKGILGKWKAVQGADELKDECERIMGGN